MRNKEIINLRKLSILFLLVLVSCDTPEIAQFQESIVAPEITLTPTDPTVENTKMPTFTATFMVSDTPEPATLTPDHSDFNSDDTETWELRPFYGELRFLVLCQDTGKPIPDVTLQVSTLRIEEQIAGQSMSSGLDGLIVIHQLERGITYWGAGPAPPTFTFSAQNYHQQIYSVAELVAGTSYDPYSAGDLPTTGYRYGTDAKEIQLPVYEFTIQLAPSD